MLRKILSLIAMPAARLYMSKERTVRKDGMSFKVPAGVFNPALFGSSNFLYAHLEKMPLEKKSILEIGTGSGILAALCARKGAYVSACDISSAAVSAARRNFRNNDLSVNVLQSDLFESLENNLFDHIIVNPPYYKRKAGSEADHAWNAGEHYEYFQKLFAGISNYLHRDGSLIMVVSSDCDLVLIRVLAKNAGMICETVDDQRYFFERQFILRFSFV